MSSSSSETPRVGFVVIGRNEGDRLVSALHSLKAAPGVIVYVDSDSTDGSVQHARETGAIVVQLDMTKQFSAARARNAGFSRLLAEDSGIAFVQFMDGDCELDSRWIEVARTFLQTNHKAAIVCGRRRERYPDRSIYNKLCDMEWNTPIGQTQECGGDFLVRADAFQQVGGFRDHMIAGEEPELCARLRAADWTIWRLDAEMTRHDANILHFWQWWRRSVRCGYSYASIAALHGRGPERLRQRQIRSAIMWGGIFPLTIVCGAFFWPAASLLFAVYPLQALRIGIRQPHPLKDGIAFGISVLVGKFSELWGIAKFRINRLRGRDGVLIEYK